jgi:hypothetical protein
MSVTVKYKKQTTDETLDMEYHRGMLLPKAGDRIVSPFNNTRFVTVVKVTSDVPRNCYEIQIDE